MGNFSEVLDRLKHELRVSKDQEVADFLGMSKTAFAERKRREVFPEEKLLAVAPEHPGVDVGYVLRGIRRGEEHTTSAAQVLRVRVLASVLGDELHKAKTSLPYETFLAVLDGLVYRYSGTAELDIKAARAEVRSMLKKGA
ncbi:helix-turn-helix domain-containing protein [Pseudomonas aeruginosa]